MLNISVSGMGSRVGFEPRRVPTFPAIRSAIRQFEGGIPADIVALIHWKGTPMTNVSAAQYLRVSTERQEYSLDFQSARIANYAQENGFEVCQTYCDEAKSGLEIGRRRGLSQLLQDVVAA